ncbi:glucose 1-dehydrogenase [Edaphobacter albus]|uniref:glucose 1-dehydrogenase n=1 Tax=Edaphobacter sp. 4G125 TaxID=2763071 RepID=UPI001646DE12|nr:glucose 1-dehydrogenase [Edaphobacter sp. 4G125]QNI36341.1 glucose 1-dehydrogenase [Edaphobacter sp. 4G125]
MGRLTGKVAIVTGASKGIGADIARGLAAEGASVVVNFASSRDGADKVVSQIAAQGGRAIAVQGNVAKESDIKRLFEETAKAFGKIDVLINNAGVYEFAPVTEFSETHFHRLFNTNVLGLLLASREAVRYFGIEGGSIINIGSSATSTTPPTSVVYTATKSAVDSITHVLSKELGPRNIRVNSINPGLIETEGTHDIGFIGGEWQKNREAQTPLGRTGQPGDITPIAVFLASEDSRWLTGEILYASGGLR